MILITGFAPFGGDTDNPSRQAAHLAVDMLNAAACQAGAVGHRCASFLEVPVVFDTSGPTVMTEIVRLNANNPADPVTVVICAGVAGNRDCISLETTAVNLQDGRIPDNDGKQPRGTPVIPVAAPVPGSAPSSPGGAVPGVPGSVPGSTPGSTLGPVPAAVPSSHTTTERGVEEQAQPTIVAKDKEGRLRLSLDEQDRDRESARRATSPTHNTHRTHTAHAAQAQAQVDDEPNSNKNPNRHRAATLTSRLPLQPTLDAIKAAGIPVAMSHDAGLYVCNSLFYYTLHEVPEPIKVGFVHVPPASKVSIAKQAEALVLAARVASGMAY